MQAFVDNLTSTHWWLSVVVVGVALNLVAAYLKPRLDHWAGRHSARAKERQVARAAKRMDLVERLRESSDERLYLLAEEMRCRLDATHFALLGIGTAILGTLAIAVTLGAALWLGIALFLFSFFSSSMAFYSHGKAMDHFSCLQEARRNVSASRL